MSTAVRTFYRLPILGWMVEDAIHGSASAKYFFAGNLVATFVLCAMMFGYAFIIVYALTATAVMMTAIVILTAGDLFSEQKRRHRSVAAPKTPKIERL